jgi:hypothetical protein
MRTLWLTGVFGAALVAVPVGAARNPMQEGIGGQPMPRPGTPSVDGRSTNGANVDKAMEAARMARLVADDRQKKIAKDSARLLELANELKTEVDKTSKDEMSLIVIRKAEEIEKLAHDLKLRMRS